MARHYLDHASTAPLRPEVAEAVRHWLERPPGDPARLHLEGRGAREVLETARDHVARLLRVRSRQVVLTSGATEAINAAVWGATRAAPGRPVLCAPVEHSAVRDASSRLAEVEPLPVDGTGRIDVAALAEVLARLHHRPPALVHCQWANHEVGTIQPVAEVVELSHRAGVPVHVDAAAAGGQVPLDLGRVGADLVSLSGHKLGAPPGVGALVVGRGKRVEPLIVGGQQERGRRAGMENGPGIVGLGAAAAALADDAGGRLAAEEAVARSHTEALLRAARSVPGVELVGEAEPARRLPHIVCLGVEGLEAEPVLLGLDRAGVAAHSGSACSSESFEPSPVLAAMGVDSSRSLRLSVGWSTTAADVEAFAEAFPAVVAELRALRS